MKIFFVGHNTFRITLAAGTVLLTDPWFKNSPLWRAVPPLCPPTELGPIHYLLSSHNHLDHIDAPSLKFARDVNAAVIGSARVAARARRAGIAGAIALAPGEESAQPAFTVRATPAFHPLAKDAIGFLIRAEGKQLYFSGDTRPDAKLIAFLQASGPVDVAFLQVACARYFGQDDGLDGRTAVALAQSFHPRIVIPMHLHARLKKAFDPQRFRADLAALKIETRIMERGEEMEV
jgi:L-ascorbate 6-phosphate lactonase